MTTPQPDEQGQTAPIELPGHQPPPSAQEFGPPPPPQPAVSAEPAEAPDVATPPDGAAYSSAPASPADDVDVRPVARPATAAQQEIMFVPLAVNIGDGFKFGCGFFLAMVVAGLVGFVLLAALFVLTGLLGLSLPLTR